MEDKFNQEDKCDSFIIMPPSLFSSYQLIRGLYSLVPSPSASLIFAVLVSACLLPHGQLQSDTKQGQICARLQKPLLACWRCNIISPVFSVNQTFRCGRYHAMCYHASGQRPFFKEFSPEGFLGGNVLKTENNR